MDPIVSPDWVIAHRDDLTLCDVRWSLDGGSGLRAYAHGHIEGAVYVDLDLVLAGPTSRSLGRHPLPDPELFAAALGGLGIGDDDTVVAYDDAFGATSARLVWMLRAIGLDAALLDGGLEAWPQPLVVEVPDRPIRTRKPRPWPTDLIADADAVAVAIDEGTVVVDARASERYRGEKEPVDPRAGHIPGAHNLPFSGNLDEHGRFLAVRFLEDRYRQVGIGDQTPVIVYCGSGVTACHDLLALERAGIGRARLYPGSWSQWSADESRPAQSGHLR